MGSQGALRDLSLGVADGEFALLARPMRSWADRTLAGGLLLGVASLRFL